MKTQDGVYTGFLIFEEKDILELKHMIKNYKPISPNDITFLYEKLKKKGKNHLVKFFEKHIMGKDTPQKISVTHTSKKKVKSESETYQKKTYKAFDFQFYDNEIRVGKYTLKTGRAFALPASLLQKIQGDFTVRIHPDKTFYFDNHGLTQLLDLVENYCYSYLDTACEAWLLNELDSIEMDVKRGLFLNFKDFALSETNGRYELKDNAVKYCVLSNWNLKYKFQDFVDKRTNIPQRYRNIYKYKYKFAKQIDKFNEEFSMCLTNIIRKYIYYTDKDLEVVRWSGNYKYMPSIQVDFKLIDEDVDASIEEYISTDSFIYYQKISLEFKYVPKGSLYEFNDNTISKIEESLEAIEDDKLYNLLNNNIQSIKAKKNIEIVLEDYLPGCSSHICSDCRTIYKYNVNNPLLDISDKHYLLGHPKIEEYIYKLGMRYINRIAYFKDPNYMLSQEWPGSKYVDCYLLANDEYIALYALDCSKSTYVFKVKKGWVDIAMFLIWSYFSSRIYNKREGKYISIQHLFSYFGIEWYDNMGSPISKNEEGLYQFILPVCFYHKNLNQ